MIANETILQWTQNDTEMHTSLPIANYKRP